MELDIAVLSRTGGRSHNEDACGFWSGPGVCFCVLSDGAGGHRGGDIASKLVVREMLGWFHERRACSSEAIEAAIQHANQMLVREQQARADVADMRATVVVLAIDYEHALATWGHVGDSRLYCFRAGAIAAQTRDDSVVQSMVDAGYLKPGDLRSAPERNQLLAALGDPERCEPAVQRELFTVQADDAFLLCSDGLWEYVDEREIIEALHDAGSAEDWLRLLEAHVLARGRPGQDNYSGLAVWCKA
jgi:serine/threonine protein phosphatase PrpC